jgi:hypothetical protein
MTDAPLDLADVLRDLGRGLALIADMGPAYKLRKAYYDGTAAEISASPMVKAALEKSAQAHPLSFANVPVDALVDKIELSSVIADGPNGDRLAAVLDDNDFEDEADDWHRKAAYFGDYYGIIDPQSEDAAGHAVDIKTIGSSPLTTVVVYSSKDGRTKLFGVKRWRSGGTWYANVYYDDATVSLAADAESRDEDIVPKADEFAPSLDAEGTPGSERVPHSGGRMLIVHYAIDGRPYGVPVHRKAFGPQDAITKISATNLSTVDSQGFPARWALADPLAELDDDIDDDFGTDGPGVNDRPDGMLKPTSGKSKVHTVPGAIAILKGIKATGTYDATTSDNFLKNLDWYVRAMAVSTGTPLFEFDMGGDQPSGESRRRASGRINKHARKVKRALGRAHLDLADTILATMGVEAPVSVNWLPTETENDKEGIELVGLKIANGVPVRDALLEAGYTDEQVDSWYPDGDPHLTPDNAKALGTALKDFGTAITLGAITDREVAAALPWLLTEARGEGTPGVPVALGLPVVAPSFGKA